MKKKLTALLAAVMIFALNLSAFAAPSVTTVTADKTGATQTAAALADGVSVKSTGIVINGVAKTVTPVVKSVPAATVTSAQTAAKSLVSANANLLKLIDVSLPESFTSAKITFDVSGVKAGQKVNVLHQKADGTWEKIANVVVGDGTVTATFTSLSPVAFVVEGTSDKTGSVSPVVTILAAICLAGAAFYGFKAFAAKRTKCAK